MSIFHGLPKEATVAYQQDGYTQYTIGDRWIYEFGEAETIDGKAQLEHSNIWYDYTDVIPINRCFKAELYRKAAEDTVPTIPAELVDCLAKIKSTLLKELEIHIGWYAKHTELQFFYKDEIYSVNPKTFGLDEIDFRPACDHDKEHYEGGGVGNADAYFETRERDIRNILSKELGIRFFQGYGQMD